MAEIALPLIGLGALYVMSNKKKENFTNRGSSNYLPNTHTPTPNYPVADQPIDNTSGNYTRQFLNANQSTDKFFSGDRSSLTAPTQNTTGFSVGLSEQNAPPGTNAGGEGSAGFNSLTGNTIRQTEFKHNNMVPFFGSKVKGPLVDSEHSQSILDNYQGSGSQQIKKVEQAPMFRPEENVQHAHGAPNRSDFLQSRQLPSTKIANVLPWEQEKVAPGLGLGYTTEGANGFNSGMMERSSWAPPTVDELRVKTNPKITYNLYGHEGPLQSKIQNPGIQGTVEKNRPTKDFALGPEHWFTTTGSSIGQTSIPEYITPEGNRNETSNQYFGVGGNDGNSKASYMTGHYEPSNRAELCPNDINPASAVGHGFGLASDYGAKGYTISQNNRNANCEAENMGNVAGGSAGMFKAMMAPIVDALRPSRKENIIGNANQTGNVTALVPSMPITNPERVKTTIKETTVDKVGMNYLNVSHVNIPKGGYHSTDIQLKEQERNKGDSSSMGFVGGTSTHEAQMNVGAWYNQRNNTNKTHENWPMPGGTSIFNSNTNIEIAKRDAERVNNRMNCSDFQLPPPGMASTVPSLDSYGKINMPEQYSHQVNSDRMNPDILSAFKENPYAQSLSSF